MKMMKTKCLSLVLSAASFSTIAMASDDLPLELQLSLAMDAGDEAKTQELMALLGLNEASEQPDELVEAPEDSLEEDAIAEIQATMDLTKEEAREQLRAMGLEAYLENKAAIEAQIAAEIAARIAIQIAEAGQGE
jgi:hypothetical protein